MTFDLFSPEALGTQLIKIGVAAMDASGEEEAALAEETFEIGSALVSRGIDGERVLASYLENASDRVRLIAACWLVKLNPREAEPILVELKRNGELEVSAPANLVLINAHNEGLLPAS